MAEFGILYEHSVLMPFVFSCGWGAALSIAETARQQHPPRGEGRWQHSFPDFVTKRHTPHVNRRYVLVLQKSRFNDRMLRTYESPAMMKETLPTVTTPVTIPEVASDAPVNTDSK